MSYIRVVLYYAVDNACIIHVMQLCMQYHSPSSPNKAHGYGPPCFPSFVASQKHLWKIRPVTLGSFLDTRYKMEEFERTNRNAVMSITKVVLPLGMRL